MHIKFHDTKRFYMLRLILFAGTLLTAIGFPSLRMVRAAQEGVSFEVLPSVIQLKPGKPVEILLILRNTTASTLQNVNLTPVTSLSIEVEHEKPDSVLPAGGVLSIKATVTQPKDHPVTGEVYFQIRYSQESDDGSVTLPGAVTAILEIQEPSAKKVEEIAEVTIETSLGQVEEQRPGQVFLVVHNLSSQPVTITKVTAHKPKFVLLEEVNTSKEPVLSTEMVLLTESKQVLPQRTYVITVPVRLSDAVQTGSQRIVFTFDLEWEGDGEQTSGSLVASHTITAGILGESDLLTLVGAPSILFLPGFLMLTMFVMLSGRLPPNVQFNLTAPEFALFSISLSLLTALGYPRITGLYGGESRSYLQAYGLPDIFMVWFFSVAIGFVGWAIYAGGGFLGKRISTFLQARRARKADKKRKEEMTRITPQVGDNPVQAVEKMGINNVPLPLEEAEIVVSGHSLYGFILMNDPADSSAVWVSPSILLKPREDPGLESDQYLERRKRDLDQIEAAQTAKDLAAVFRRAADTWDIEWNDRGALSGPRRVLLAELKDRRKSAQPFVAPE